MTQLMSSWAGPALAAVLLAGSLLVVASDWRLSLFALAVEYLAVAILISQLVLLGVVAVKLLVGLMVVAILTITGWQLNFGRPAIPGIPQWQLRFAVPTGMPFRVMATLLLVVVAAYIASQPSLILPGLDPFPAVNTASYLLIALGLLTLGLTEEPINAGMGLLTLLMGFELFYAVLEPALAVVALLAAVQFGIAVAVSYLAMVQHSAPGEA